MSEIIIVGAIAAGAIALALSQKGSSSGGLSPTATTDKTSYNPGDTIQWTTTGWNDPANPRVLPSVQGVLADSNGNLVGNGDILQVDATGKGNGKLIMVGVDPGNYSFYVKRLGAGLSQQTPSILITLVSQVSPPVSPPSSPSLSGATGSGIIENATVTITTDKTSYVLGVDQKMFFTATGFKGNPTVQALLLDADKNIAGSVSGAILVSGTWIYNSLPLDLSMISPALRSGYLRLQLLGGGDQIDVGPIGFTIPQTADTPILTINGSTTQATEPKQGGSPVTFAGSGFTPHSQPVMYIIQEANPDEHSGGNAWALGWFALGGALTDAQGNLSPVHWNWSATGDLTWHFWVKDSVTGKQSNQVDVIQGSGSPVATGPAPAYVPPSSPPSLRMTDASGMDFATDANGLPQLHLPTDPGQILVCSFKGNGWGQNVPGDAWIVVYIEAQNTPVPGTPNPFNDGNAHLDSEGNIVSGLSNMNSAWWPPGQILTIWGELVGPNYVPYNVKSTPWQFKLV